MSLHDDCDRVGRLSLDLAPRAVAEWDPEALALASGQPAQALPKLLPHVLERRYGSAKASMVASELLGRLDGRWDGYWSRGGKVGGRKESRGRVAEEARGRLGSLESPRSRSEPCCRHPSVPVRETGNTREEGMGGRGMPFPPASRPFLAPARRRPRPPRAPDFYSEGPRWRPASVPARFASVSYLGRPQTVGTRPSVPRPARKYPQFRKSHTYGLLAVQPQDRH